MTQSPTEFSKAYAVDSVKKVPIRVLHVDDDVCFLKTAKSILEMQEAFQVDTASSVEAAAEKMKKKTYDVIVCDYLMPGKDGLQFLRELREKGNSIPFIIFTGKGREEVAIKALNLGADNYVSKTGDPETVYSELSHDITNVIRTKHAEQEAADLARFLSENPNPVLRISKDGTILYANAAAKSLPCEPKAEIGQLAPDFLHESIAAALDSGTKKEIEFKQGDRTFLLLLTPVTNNAYVNVYGLDITRRKRAEESIRESEMRLQNLTGATPAFICEIDAKGMIQFANRTYEGVTNEQVVGTQLTSWFPKEQTSAIDSIVKKVFRTGQRQSIEYTIPNPKGELRSYVAEVGPMEWKGEIRSAVLTATDITEHKRAEEKSRESENKFKSIFDSAGDGLIHLDASGRVLDVNREALRIFDGSKEEVLGKHFTKIGIFSPKDMPTLTRNFASILRGRKVVLNITIKNKKGQMISLECSASLQKMNGKSTITAVARDITERKKIEETLKGSEAKYRKLVEQSLQGIVVAQGVPPRVVFANPAVVQISGYTSEELASRSIECLIHPDERAAFLSRFKKLFEGKLEASVDEGRAIRKDGKIVWIAVSSKRIEYNGRPAVQAMLVDITEHRRIEQSLGEKEKRYRELANSLPEIVFETDTSGKLTFVNRRAVEITGYAEEDFAKGLSAVQFVVPEDRDRAKENLMEALSGKTTGANEYTFVRKDGSTVPVMTRSTQIVREDKVVGIRGIIVDITERKKMEESLRENEKRLKLMNEKLRVVGELTRHDVRNKLSTIAGHIFLGKKKLAGHPELLEDFRDMESACSQTVKILDFAKVYERLGVEELAYVDVEKTVQEAVLLLSDLKGVTVVNQCHGLTVLADSLLRQLFYNLIDNSLKHGQKVRQIKVNYKEKNQDELELVYEDDGVGIPATEKPMIFREGYSTSGSTGYGLHLIGKTVEVYGWTIQETSEPSKGAKFIITIPKTGNSGKANYNVQ